MPATIIPLLLMSYFVLFTFIDAANDAHSGFAVARRLLRQAKEQKIDSTLYMFSVVKGQPLQQDGRPWSLGRDAPRWAVPMPPPPPPLPPSSTSPHSTDSRSRNQIKTSFIMENEIAADGDLVINHNVQHSSSYLSF